MKNQRPTLRDRLVADPELKRDLEALVRALTSADPVMPTRAVAVFRQQALPPIRSLVLDRLIEQAAGRWERGRPQATTALQEIGQFALERLRWRLLLCHHATKRCRLIDLLATISPMNDRRSVMVLDDLASDPAERPVVRAAARQAVLRLSPDFYLYALEGSGAE